MNIRHNVSCAVGSFFPKLTKIWLEVSDLCNSRCSTCLAWQRKESKNVLDIERLFSSPLLKDVTYILNSGSGEPGLADLEQILTTEHRLLPKARLQVSTNGLLPSKVADAIETALKNGASIDVGISLDGIGEKHDAFRGVKGNFEKVTALLNNLEELKVSFPHSLDVCLGSTLTDYTVQNSKEMQSFAQKHHVSFMWNWFNPSESFYGNIKPLTANADIITEVLNLPKNPYNNRWLESLQSGNIPKFKCYSLRSFCAIRCDGEVVPCLSKYDSSIGNFMHENPADVWHSKKANVIRNTVKNCEGCLNSWGCWWSLNAQYFELLRFKLRNKIRRNDS